MKIYLITDWNVEYNNIYTTKEEVYERIFEVEMNEEDFDIKEKMKEVSWDELMDECDGGEITIEEYGIN